MQTDTPSKIPSLQGFPAPTGNWLPSRQLMNEGNDREEGRGGRTWTEEQKTERSQEYKGRRDDFVEAGKKGGRPAYDDAKRRQRTVGTTFSSEEKAAVARAAREAETTQADFIRTAVIEEALGASKNRKARWRSAPQKVGQSSYPPTDEPRTKQVNTPLRPREDDALTEVAGDVDLSKSSVIRLAVLSRLDLAE